MVDIVKYYCQVGFHCFFQEINMQSLQNTELGGQCYMSKELDFENDDQTKEYY